MAGWADYLDPDERVLWEGAPVRRLFLLRGIDTFLIPFSLVWGGGVFGIAVTAFSSGVSGPPDFILLLFALVAVYITVGCFFVDQYVRRPAVYALTTKRAVIAERAFGRSLRSYALNQGADIYLSDCRIGSVSFGEQTGFLGNLAAFGMWHGSDGSFTFRGLREPVAVYKIARQIARGEGEAL